jgi:hypothetical protein
MEIKDMTLTQITLMNLSPRQRTAAEMSISECEREIKRRLKAAGEITGGVITLLAFAALMWAFAALTPAQRSAEADLAATEMEVR